MADILAKRSRGEPLTLAERGRLSWYGRQKPPKAGPAVSAPSTGAPAVAGSPPAEALGGSLVPPDVDPQLVRDPVAALVTACDGLRQNFVATVVEKLRATPPTVNRFASRAGMQPATKTVLVDTSPAVAKALGLRSDYFPIGAFCAALTADCVGFGVLLKEIRALKRELEPRPAPVAPRAESAVPAPGGPA